MYPTFRAAGFFRSENILIISWSAGAKLGSDPGFEERMIEVNNDF